MADTGKDTIYIDVDDEITAIIEKVRDSKHKIVALVLPKRTSALQSIVNMKLLKRTAKSEDKNLVLITSESGLLPIAGAVGLHVAKTLQTKPSIPAPPEVPSSPEAVIDDGVHADSVDKTKTVGELAGAAAVIGTAKQEPLEETIDIDNLDDNDDKTKSGKKDKKTKDKGSKIKVPNFDKFRLRLLLAGAGLILLIVFLFFATKVWPKATVTIQTNAVSVNTTFSFTADTAAKSLDEVKSTVPATVRDENVSNNLKVPATGQKNVGDPATGTMTMYYCPSNNSAQITVPSGTVFSSSGISFATTADAVVPASNFTGGGNCKKDQSQTANVTATQGGASSNVAAASYVSNLSGVTGTGSAMTGGTDKTVTVVQQSDIDGAVEKLTQNTDKAKVDLTAQLKDAKLFPLPATILAGKQTISSDAKVGDQASDVTVTAQTDFTMLGVKRDDLKKLVVDSAKSQIDTSKQDISDDGLDLATFAVTTHASANNQTLSVQTTATAGAQINTDSLKTQIIGKKSGDVQQLIQDLPSVQSVNVKFSPFWVNKVTKNTKRINIIVLKSQASSNGSN